MKIHTLYYYDKPLFEPWLNHYCHLPCIDEILIQDQNWSDDHTKHLYRTVAKYIDDFNIKISIMPSQYQKIGWHKHNSQFTKYGLPTIMNRIIQVYKNECWIIGAPDEVIYKTNYDHTNKILLNFEAEAKERNQSIFGYLPLLRVVRHGVFHKENVWKNRVNYTTNPLKFTGAKDHDERLDLKTKDGWVGVTTASGYRNREEFKDYDRELDLNLIHYHEFTRPNNDIIYDLTPKIINKEDHPRHYISKWK